MALVIRFLKALSLSLFVEVPLLALLSTRGPLKNKKEPVPLRTILITGILATCATLPYIWFVFIRLANGNVLLYWLIAEGFVVILEAVFYMTFLKSGVLRGGLWSLICNAASFSTGVVLGRFLY